MVGIGSRIGPYELVEQLAQTDRVALYRAVRTDGARDPRQVGMRVAIDPRDVGAVSLVRREYELLRSLDDPRIRRTFAFYAAHGAAALEWVDGPTLHAVLRLSQNGFLDFDVATRMDVLIEVAYALRHAHSASRTDASVVHGRLNPRTVRFGADGRVVLVDFGLTGGETDFVLPPEAAVGAMDPASDQWLLGALSFEVLTGEPVLPPGSDPRKLDVVALGERVNRVCPPMAKVIARALATDPTQRYFPDAALLKDMLAAQRHIPGISRRSELISLAIRRRISNEAVEVPMQGRGRSTLPPLSPVSTPLPAVSPVSDSVSVPVRQTPRPAPTQPPPASAARSPKMLYQNQQDLVEAVVDETSGILEIPLAGGPGLSRGMGRKEVAPAPIEPVPYTSEEVPKSGRPKEPSWSAPNPRQGERDQVSSADWTLLGILVAMFVVGLALVAWRYWV